MRRIALAWLVILALGCGSREPDHPADTQQFALKRTATGGPVTLTVRLSAERIGLADTLILEEEVAAEPGFAAELPEFLPEEFEGLGVIDLEDFPARITGQATIERRRLVLEPEHSGTLTIPSREAWFAREGDTTESSVSTDPIEIEVRPIEDAASLSLPAPRPALRVEEIPGSGELSPWWASLLLLPAAAAIVLVLRRKKRKAPAPRPAHEIAWESFRRLVALDLIEKGEVERFFVILSAILREYVERRFRVRAPDRTTKEFLAEAARHPDLAGFRPELSAFLTVADRVKFARFSPDEDDIQQAFDRAKSFVAGTKGEESNA